jgi:prevent-host-death family protein
MVYIMSTMQINIKEARQRFSELVNTVALRGERVVITSRNKPKAVLISLRDAETLETDSVRRARRQMQLESIRKLRLRLAQKGVAGDSQDTLEEIRRERLGNLSNDH